MTIDRKLRIVHTESSCGWGGQEIRILTESQGMLERGHSVHLLCVQDSNIHREALKRGIPVTALPIARKKLKGVFALRTWLKANPVDVINTHSSTDSWLVALARIGLGIPVVRTRHVSAVIPDNAATRWLYTRGCDFVVTTGEQLRQHVIERVEALPEKVMSVPTGIDERKFVPGDGAAARISLGLPVDARIVGIVATIRTWKGHIYLVEALAKLQRDDVYLLIVGDGPNQANVQAAIDQHQLNERVIFAGQQDNVVPWLQAMDIFALPSYANEGVPQSLMQAMMCGIPVISTPVGSIAELIVEGESGILVPPKDSEALVTGLGYMLAEAEYRHDRSRNALAHVRSNYTMQKMINDMEKVFQSLIG